MAQFEVYRLRRPDGRLAEVVWLSSDMLVTSGTVVVAPLRSVGEHGMVTRRIHVPVRLGEIDAVVAMDELISLPQAVLGTRLGDLTPWREAFISGLDFIFTGY